MLKAFQLFLHIVFRSFCLYLVGIANKVEILLIGLFSFENPWFRFIVLIEVFGVDARLQFRNEGRLHISDLTPVDIIEPGVALDLISTISAKPGVLVG